MSGGDIPSFLSTDSSDPANEAISEKLAFEKAEKEKEERAAAEIKAAAIRIDIHEKIIELQRTQMIADVLRVDLDKILADNAEAARLAALAEEEESDDGGGEEEEEEDASPAKGTKIVSPVAESDEEIKARADQDRANGEVLGEDSKMTLESESVPAPPAIIVTPEEVVKEMTAKLAEMDSGIMQLKEDLGLMQNAYEILLGISYKASALDMAEISLINYFYFFQYQRKFPYLIKFYRESSELNVDGLDGASGGESIVNSIISSLDRMEIEVKLDPFDIDKDPPARCAAFVKCNYFLKVDKDWPRKVLEVFEFNFDDDNNIYIRKQIFISRGSRPLYIFALGVVPKVVPPKDPKFRDNRESMFLEREEMSKNDYDAPFVVDTRTDKEIEDSLSIGDHSQVSRTSAGGKSIGGENLQSSVNGGSESVTNGLDNVVKKKGWSLF